MLFYELNLPGAYEIKLEKKSDSRGYFSRMFCQRELVDHSLRAGFVQSNRSYNRYTSTFRGMHYQLAEASEDKLVTCISGTVYDLLLDLRTDSETFGCHVSVTLNANEGNLVYVPKGFAHGFLTREDHTEVVYFVTNYYTPEREKGIRWNDPYFQLELPEVPQIISEKDQNHPDFNKRYHLEV